MMIVGFNIQILVPAYDTPEVRESLVELMKNHKYNMRTDWQEYRRIKRWRKK